MIQIDMEMPKTCGQCFCAMRDYDYNTVRCRLIYDLCFDANSRDYSNRRLDGCPLHEPDPDTVSRQAVLENVCTMLQNCFDATDEMIESVKITIGELPPSPTPSRQAEQPEQEYDECDVCNFTGNCTSWDKIERILHGGICPRDKAGIRRGVRYD